MVLKLLNNSSRQGADRAGRKGFHRQRINCRLQYVSIFIIILIVKSEDRQLYLAVAVMGTGLTTGVGAGIGPKPAWAPKNSVWYGFCV